MSKRSSDKPERLVAENISEVVWLRLRRFTSQQLCRRIIEKRTNGLAEEVIDQKANGMAWAMRSALGYWDTKSGGLNAKVLSRYYALLQISIAEQIGSNDTEDNLLSVQRHTEKGHGLFAMQKSDTSFPNDFLIGCLNTGHFGAYCKRLNLDLTPFFFKTKPRDFSEIADTEIPRFISLSDLIRRIPELQTVMLEYLDASPLSFQIGHANRNMLEESARRTTHLHKTGQLLYDPPEEKETITTYVAIYPHDDGITADELNRFGFPIKNIVKEDKVSPGEDSYYVGEMRHAPPKQNWWNYIDTYKSGYCGTSVIVPFWGTNDPFLLHLVILYAFSIIVRYLPEKWHDIEDGKYDHIRALLEHYMVIVDNVLPKLVIERLTGTKIHAVQPGSFQAPI